MSFQHHNRPVMLAASEGRREGLLAKLAYMLNARQVAVPLKTALNFTDLSAGDLFVFLRSELQEDQPHEYADWFADSFLLHGEAPSFLHRAARVEYAGKLAVALGLSSGQQLRERLAARRDLLRKGLSSRFLFYMTQPLPNDVVDKIATRP